MQRTAEAGSRRSTPRSRPKPTRGALEQGAPERGVDEPRRAPAAWAGHSRSPGRIRKERVRERDRIRGAKAQRALPTELVQGPRNDREPDRVELFQETGNGAWKRSIDERLEQDRFSTV